MSELIDLVRRVTESVTGNEEIEAFASHERSFETRVFSGEIDSISSAEPRGIGIRVIVDHKVGFAYSTDITDAGLRSTLQRARDNAAFATPDEVTGVAPAWGNAPEPIEGLVDDLFGDATVDDKTGLALKLDEVARTIDPRIRTVEDSVYADSYGEVAISTSTGIEGSYASSDAWCYAVAIAEDDGDTQVGFEFGLARGLGGIDPDEVAQRAARRALDILGATKIPSARMPIVLDPYTAGQFLGVIGSALTGEAVQKGRSLFAGKLGETVAGGMTLVDDGRVPGAPGSSPWDDEGTPTQRTEIITGGVLKRFLYDLPSARRDNVASTGNASRAGFKSAPGPSPSNLALDPTGESRDEVLAAAGRALLVQDFHGVHSGANPVSGDFSVGVTGRLLENGTPGAPVKEVTIAAPMLEILSSITAVADDRRWLPFGGSYGGATTLVSEMTVAGL